MSRYNRIKLRILMFINSLIKSRRLGRYIYRTTLIAIGHNPDEGCESLWFGDDKK